MGFYFFIFVGGMVALLALKCAMADGRKREVLASWVESEASKNLLPAPSAPLGFSALGQQQRQSCPPPAPLFFVSSLLRFFVTPFPAPPATSKPPKDFPKFHKHFPRPNVL
jgi:hypothetical protein